MLAPIRFLGRDRSGDASAEFALLGLLFFALIFAIVEIALIMLSQIALDNAVARVARQLQTGQLQKSALSEGDFRKLLCAQAGPMLACSGLHIDLRSYASYAAVPTAIPLSGRAIDTSALTYDPPAPNAIGALRVFYKWPLTVTLVDRYLAMTSDNARVLVGTAVAKIEPY